MRFTIAIDEELSFIFPIPEMAEEIFDVLNQNRQHLGEFLDFIPKIKTIDDEKTYLKMKLQGMVNETDCLFVITKKETLIGMIDLHFIDKEIKKAEIGYWLTKDYTKQGIMKKAVRALCTYAFDTLELKKLSIRAVQENQASNQVARASGFTFVGTLRQDSLLYGEPRNLCLYERLSTDS